jgi:hypothetical protein
VLGEQTPTLGQHPAWPARAHPGTAEQHVLDLIDGETRDQPPRSGSAWRLTDLLPSDPADRAITLYRPPPHLSGVASNVRCSLSYGMEGDDRPIVSRDQPCHRRWRVAMPQAVERSSHFRRC